MSTNAPGHTVAVRLICDEVVVANGTRTTQWQIREQNDWLPAHRHPSCTSERGQAGPGTVWQETLTLRLAPGTQLRKRIVEPSPPASRSAFDYLRRDVRNTARKTREIQYRVGGSGELVRSDPRVA